MAEHITRKNINNESSLPLTISSTHGLVSQTTYFNSQVASASLRNYYLIKKGEFAYNKSTSTGYPYGAVRRLDKYESGVLSIIYIIFLIKDPYNIDSEFLCWHFENDLWHKEVKVRATEGARNHGLLNISAKDFFDIACELPVAITEQTLIGSFFRSLDRLITLHQRTCSPTTLNFTKQPAGNKIAWEQRKFSEIAITRRGLTYRPADISKNGKRVLRSSNIHDDTFVKSSDDVFVHEGAVNIPYANNGDILITSANGSTSLVGKHAIIRGIFKNSVIHGGFMLLATAKNPDFINASMSSQWYSAFINLFVAGGNGAIGNLNKNDLDEQLIKVPSESEQTRIGAFFRSLDRLITLHQRKQILFAHKIKFYAAGNGQF